MEVLRVAGGSGAPVALARLRVPGFAFGEPELALTLAFGEAAASAFGEALAFGEAAALVFALFARGGDFTAVGDTGVVSFGLFAAVFGELGTSPAAASSERERE